MVVSNRNGTTQEQTQRECFGGLEGLSKLRCKKEEESKEEKRESVQKDEAGHSRKENNGAAGRQGKDKTRFERGVGKCADKSAPSHRRGPSPALRGSETGGGAAKGKAVKVGDERAAYDEITSCAAPKGRRRAGRKERAGGESWA